MNQKTLQYQITKMLSEKLGNHFHISVHKIQKTNIELDGLLIQKKGELLLAPVIYLAPFYEDLQKGMTLDIVTDKILDTFFQAGLHTVSRNIEASINFSLARENLFVELINKHFNKALLRDTPHTLFLDDFAIVVRCFIDTLPEYSSNFLVNNHNLKAWDIKQKELLSLAVQNTKRLLGIDLIHINDAIKEMDPDYVTDHETDVPMWIMTNRKKFYGAATALFDDALKDFASTHGSFYVIFSSIHEILLLPTPDNSSIEILSKMNQEVNATQVQASEVLGTKAYFYHHDSGFIL